MQDGCLTHPNIASNARRSSAPASLPDPRTFRRPGGPSRLDDYFPAFLFFLAESFFQRVGIRLVYFVRDVLADPGARLVELERGVLLRDLLHADKDLHIVSCSGYVAAATGATYVRCRTGKYK